MSSAPLPPIHGALDAEIQRIEGLNYAKPVFGLLPIYDFPASNLSTTAPAIQLHGVWFRVNPVSKEALNARKESERLEILEAENEHLIAQMSQMKDEMEKLQVELASVRNRRELEQRVMSEERKEISALRLELESFKRRQAGTAPRIFRTPSGANASESHQSTTTPGTPGKGQIVKSPSSQVQAPTGTSSRHLTSSNSSVRLSNGVSSGTPHRSLSFKPETADQAVHTPASPATTHKRHRESLQLAGYVLPVEEDHRMPWEKSN
jgi:hypothetical protein